MIPVEIRAAEERDRRPLADLLASVAEERDGIATEPPIEVEERARTWRLDGTLVAVAGEEVVGSLHVERSRFGFGEFGMMVARDWRSRGVGSALVAAAIEWGHENGLHKLTLSVFPTTAPRSGPTGSSDSSRKAVVESRYDRANGEIWDLIEMGLRL